MKVLDLRNGKIEPDVGENVSIITDSQTYECVAIEVGSDFSCTGCALFPFENCDYILCSNGRRKDKKSIILKCLTIKRREVKNE